MLSYQGDCRSTWAAYNRKRRAGARARYRGKRVGQFGQIASFSFYPSKNLGAYGEAGALVTNDASVAQRARSLRDHAQSQKYFHDEIEYNYRMDSFQAAVLAIKLKRLDA
jgi:dTDP-4-amino-4,6-dideoxygalactose transaminase